jgi:hypothetical protein
MGSPSSSTLRSWLKIIRTHFSILQGPWSVLAPFSGKLLLHGIKVTVQSCINTCMFKFSGKREGLFPQDLGLPAIALRYIPFPVLWQRIVSTFYLGLVARSLTG